jgi:tRNA(Arg) A34 adenosine deaminase TadA
MAIRNACKALGTFLLDDCELYTSCEPCPMCLAALYWSRCAAIFFGNTKLDAADAGFDDSFLYTEVQKPIEDRTIPTSQVLPEQAIVSFNIWCERTERIDY